MVKVPVVGIYFCSQRGTLAQELSRRELRKQHFNEKEILRLFSAICNAVIAFHSAQPYPYAHRDLKPANVLLDDRHNPVIMDLGEVFGFLRTKPFWVTNVQRTLILRVHNSFII